MRSRRAHIVVLGALLVALLAMSVTAALFALPVLAILALLSAGRYVGEERILARRERPRVRRAPSRRWRPSRPDGVRSLLARTPRTFRGPPIFAA